MRPIWQQFPAHAGLHTLLESHGRPPSSEVAPDNGGNIALTPKDEALNFETDIVSILRIPQWKENP